MAASYCVRSPYAGSDCNGYGAACAVLDVLFGDG